MNKRDFLKNAAALSTFVLLPSGRDAIGRKVDDSIESVVSSLNRLSSTVLGSLVELVVLDRSSTSTNPNNEANNIEN